MINLRVETLIRCQLRVPSMHKVKTGVQNSPTQKYIVHTIYCNILSTIYCIVVVNNTNILYCSS